MQKLPLLAPCLGVEPPTPCVYWHWQNLWGARLAGNPSLPRGQLQVDRPSSHLEFSASPMVAGEQAEALQDTCFHFHWSWE